MNPLDRPRLIDTGYPAVRRVMGPDRGRLGDPDLEVLLAGLFPESDPVDVEDFMRGLQSFGRQAAPLAQRALPGVIQGAATGATVAGPWGAVAGAIGGGVASLAGGGGAPRQAPQPGAPARPMQGAPARPGSATAPAGALPAPGDVGAPNAAAAQLLALLSRPETMQALLSLLMANAGRSSVQVGSQPVPAAAFANAISELASEAAAADSPMRQDLSEYLLDDHGNPRGDIYNPAERAALLLGELATVAEIEAVEDAQYEPDGEEFDDTDAAGDPLDGYEAALEGRIPHDD